MSSNEVIARLDAAISALGDVDVSGLSDDTLRNQLTQLSSALCQVDAQLARLAEAVRARGYAIIEEALREEPLATV
jgi:hypothetical protein